MTHEQIQQLEKTPRQSKKFTAWLIQQVLMTGMAITALVKQPELGWPLASFMGGIIFMMGISTMWYLGKQAAVDATVRGYLAVKEASHGRCQEEV
jgi:hypothetical protein